MGMDWKGVVRRVAPALGTALGGPMAGTAVKFIADKLLGNPDATQAEVSQAILTATPDQLMALKKLDNEFQVQMRQLDIDLEKINAEDRKSARDLAVKTTLIPQITISVIFISSYLVVTYKVFGEGALDPTKKDILLLLVGILSAGLTQILNFFFGSSAGSKHKDASIGTLINK